MRVQLKPAWRTRSDSHRVYHTEDCQYVERANEGAFKTKELEDIPDEVKECNACQGEFPQREGYSHEFNEAVQDMDPEDLGLTPIGER